MAAGRHQVLLARGFADGFVASNAYPKVGLKQMLSVEDVRFQRKRGDAFHATEVDPEMTGLPRSFVKSIDSADLAEIMLAGCTAIDLSDKLFPGLESKRFLRLQRKARRRCAPGEFDWGNQVH